MRPFSRCLRLFFYVLLFSQLIFSSVASLNRTPGNKKILIGTLLPASAAAQSANLRIVGPKGESNPVVNEGNQLQLQVIDSSGQPATGTTFQSGSPDIASVDAVTGMVGGIQQGFATITARRGNDSISEFVVVTRVSNG